MRRIFTLFSLALPLFTATFAYGQASQVNPVTQVNWYQATGAGVPSSATCPYVTTGTTVLSSPNVAVASVAGLVPGLLVTGTGIPSSTTVSAVNTVSVQVTLTANATAGNTGVTLDFYPLGRPYTDTTHSAQYVCTPTGWVTSTSSGVTQINGTAGAFTFSGSGVSCTTTTCTFTGAGSGIGSIAWTVPAFMTATPSTLSASGTQVFSLNNQLANQFLAGPATGSATAPGFRYLVNADVPATLTGITIDGVTPTTMGYLDATSSIQTQLNGKQGTIGYSPAATGSCTSGQYGTGTTTSGITCAVVQYAQLGGSVPTWNQSTTGTAANVTASSNSTLTTLSALSLPYSQLTGAPATSTTVNGQTCALGGTCTITASAGTISVGVTSVASGTSGYLLSNNAGTLGNLAISGLSIAYSQLTGTPATSTTVNGQTCALGGTCTISASAGSITVGTTTIASGTNNYILTNASGTLANVAASSLTVGNISASSNSTLNTLSGLSLPYSQLTGTPTVPTSSSWPNAGSCSGSQYVNGLTNGSTPTCATVAYSQLSGPPTLGTWAALNYPVWSTGTPFVTMTAAGTFALSTTTYLTGNQTITLGGILSGSGSTSITASAAAGYYMPTTTDQSNWNGKQAALTNPVTGPGGSSSTVNDFASCGNTGCTTILDSGYKASSFVTSSVTTLSSLTTVAGGAFGSAAFTASTAYDASGSAATAQSNAQTYASNANNLSSGTVASGRISGSYTGITGVGTLSTGSIPYSLLTGPPTIPTSSSWPGPGTCTSGQYVDAIANGTTPTCAQVAYSQLSGSPPDAWLPEKIVPANCNNTGSAGTAGNGFSLPAADGVTPAVPVCRIGTNVTTGYLQFQASSAAQFQDEVPGDWDSPNEPYVRLNFTQANATSSQTIIFQIQAGCSTGGNDDPTWETAQTFSTTTTGSTANTQYTETLQLNSTTMTGCTAGGMINFLIIGSGSMTSTANLQMVTITWPHKPWTAEAN